MKSKLVFNRKLVVLSCSLGLVIVLLIPFVSRYMRAATDTTAAEAAKIDERIKEKKTIQVVSSILAGPSTIEVTFDGKFDHFNVNDIAITEALGTWYSLEPMLNVSIPIKTVKTRENKQNQTVAAIEIGQNLNPNATFTKEEKVSPGKAPYLTAKYYSGSKEKDIEQANNLITWQMDNGGWFKNMFKEFQHSWDGKATRSEWRTKNGGELGTIDNDASTNEMLFMAVMYKETGDSRYKDSVLKAIDFLQKMQYPTGGWPQVYPARGNYSDYVTFNDNAMIRVMNVLTLITNRKYPFDSDLVNNTQREQIQHSLERGVDYILKSQINVNGELTAWCAQHAPDTYEPRPARAYEFPSISGAESVGIVQYLMMLPNPSEDVKKAIQGALNWFEAARVDGTKFIPSDPKNVYFVPDPNSSIWYRFYEIGTNLPIFSGRESVIRHNLLEIEEERRNGYAWAGNWPAKLLQVARTTGYFENHVYVRVVGLDSKDTMGLTLKQGQLSIITAPGSTK